MPICVCWRSRACSKAHKSVRRIETAWLLAWLGRREPLHLGVLLDAESIMNAGIKEYNVSESDPQSNIKASRIQPTASNNRPEWIFWIYGVPNRPQPQPFTKCIVHQDEIKFETQPPSTISLGTIKSCKTTSSGSGFSYDLQIKIAFVTRHPKFGKDVFFTLINPLLAMWSDSRPSTLEFRAFEQLVNALRVGIIPDIDPNPYRRAIGASHAHVSGSNIADAHTPPKPQKGPNTTLILVLILIVSGIIIWLNVKFLS